MFLFCISMDGYDFTLAGAGLTALSSGALWWAEAGLLCVSDLHLGKAERLARRGGPLLPPYEAAETVARLNADIRATEARTVVCLGDSFDDTEANAQLPDDVRDALSALMSGRRWIWITGNHDPEPALGSGRAMAQLDRGALTFRHITERSVPEGGEVSGHFHPKMQVLTAGRRITRPCFVLTGQRLILPAYGCYTGGLRIDDPAFERFTRGGGLAILTGRRPCAIPLPPAAVSA